MWRFFHFFLYSCLISSLPYQNECKQKTIPRQLCLCKTDYNARNYIILHRAVGNKLVYSHQMFQQVFLQLIECDWQLFLQLNPSCATTNFSRSHYFAHILQMPLYVVVLYNQQTKVACGSTDQHFAVSRTLCMIMVKDKLFIEHNIFHQVCFTLLRPEVGVAPQCVLVCGASMCAK